MKTYPIIQDGPDPFAFEIDQVYLSRRTIARILGKIEGMTEVHVGGRFGSPDDVRIEFKCQGNDYIVMEPFGDNSRYWLVRRVAKTMWRRLRTWGRSRPCSRSYKLPLPVKLFGDLVSLNFKGLFRHRARIQPGPASTLGEGVKVSAPVRQVGVTAAAGGGGFG